MSSYVLIHGAWHGGWCWDYVVPHLEAEGHKVVAPDLPGHGKDRRSIPEITMQAYTDRVCQILDAQSDPVILVGHSMGGAVITQAAEYRSEKIKTLVYLAAYLLQNGEHILQVGSADSESLLTANVIVTEDQSYCTVKEEALREVFYGYCSNKVIEYAKQNLVPQATAPLVTPIRTTVSNFGSIHRVYITCLQDKAVSPTEQEKMYNALPCEKVIPMNTDHSAFFSAPEELAKNLLSI